MNDQPANNEIVIPGLRRNWRQFWLLVLVNAFVGGMVGLERSILPQYASERFSIVSNSAILSFIVAFGISKAIANYYTGKLANKYGRRKLLIIGWLLAIPVPVFLMYAPNWNWIVVANILLGISQGLTWSSTVVMKIDLAGEKDRGLAMGLNEFAGYLAVGIVAYLAGYIANYFGITPYAFYLGIAISVTGLFISVLFVKDTSIYTLATINNGTIRNQPLKNVFIETTFSNKTLSTITQAGLVNNLNDGMIWGLLPVILMKANFTGYDIGIIAAIYPMIWGIGQLFTGKLSDVINKKSLLFWGMLLQAIALLFMPFTSLFYGMAVLAALIGIGTAMVYPTFLSAIADATNPTQMAESVGTFRLWRDLGYAFGAIISGIAADVMGMTAAVILIGLITLLSALIILTRMPRKL